MRLQDKVVIVTGGGNGIGRAYCERLAAEGAAVVVAELDAEAAAETARRVAATGGQALAIQTDVADWESCQRMAKTAVARFGRIDVLVNNAAVFATVPISRVPFDAVPPEEWDLVMTVNLKGMWQACRAVVPQMRRQGGGKIINISSGSWLSGHGERIHYVTSKAGVIGFTRTLARELGQDRITVNAVSPGSTLSEHPDDAGAVAMRQKAAGTRCLQRVQVPADLVGVIAFLCSDDAGFMTGQQLVVDGGNVMV